MKKAITISNDQQGWAKLQRSLLDSAIIKNPNLLQIYIWSLLKANHKAKWVSINGKEVYCNVGQFITGRKVAAEELGMKEGTYYSNIKKLEEYGYLEIESSNKFSIVTVVNYGGVAPIAMPMEQQKKKEIINRRTTKKQPTNTNNNVKNVKKEKKEKEKKIENPYSIIISKNYEDEDYLKMAYKVFNTTIRECLPNVASIPNQLSFDEFKSIYEKYDFDDINYELGKLDKWKDIRKQSSLFKILLIFLKNNKEVKPLLYGEENHFEMEEDWYADTDEVDSYIERVKKRKVFKESKHYGSQNDMRYFIRQYLFWVKAFADERYPRFEILKKFTLKQAIQFEEDYLEFWSSEEYVDDLHYSEILKECESAYELLCKHTKKRIEHYN